MQPLSCASASRPLLDDGRSGGERDNGDDVSGAWLATNTRRPKPRGGGEKMDGHS